MSNAPLMPMATAVWLVENTTLTFKQIADFCKMHEVEIQGIADGEVAKGIKAYNPIISGQLTREEINLSSEDQNRPLEMQSIDIEISKIDSPLDEKMLYYEDENYEKNEDYCWLNIGNGKCYSQDKIFEVGSPQFDYYFFSKTNEENLIDYFKIKRPDKEFFLDNVIL